MNVFFDLDGTLTDPREGILDCLRFALSSLGVQIPGDAELEQFIGPPLHKTFRLLCEDHVLAEKALAIYRRRYAETGLYQNRLYEGVDACLEHLDSKVDFNYVVTSKPAVYANRIVEHFGIHRRFKVVYGSNLDGSLSDKAELLAHVLKSEQLHANDCVMVGDRSYDVVGAKHHGIRSIGVLWGYGSEGELREAGADSLCESPKDLVKTLFAP